jgi:hypothetical protein
LQDTLFKKACMHGMLLDKALHIMTSDQLFLLASNRPCSLSVSAAAPSVFRRVNNDTTKQLAAAAGQQTSLSANVAAQVLPQQMPQDGCAAGSVDMHLLRAAGLR